ncbi:hypothetical protein SAMN05216262_12824 [Colwellia chukchiensis]|uniref:HutD family protein n=1 Tax=Colwellia chukchiensis TaxID=641665 RepID=A0A1H7TSG8_9GAMM|nr:HutD family protein [Colwellia chukchiensis]SEL87691.1 hypothetical protein SAMN05216262_12824 [Colwellia chukchiensis]
MIEIITPQHFTTVPWKNGKGETLELAINPGGSLDNFQWRLSMATVSEDGVFSNFSGYTRNLVLIDGNGINLQHDDNKIDRLTQLLDVATFDGGAKTVANLPAGEITDFNVITDSASVNAKVNCQPNATDITLAASEICFIYSLFNPVTLTALSPNNPNTALKTVAAGELIKITNLNKNSMQISGDHLIVVYLNTASVD